MTGNLFELVKKDFRIVRISDADVKRSSDYALDLHRLVLECEERYPQIDRWLTNKVLPQLRTPQREAFVGYQDGEAVVSAVLKRGEKSKFCHLRVTEGLRDSHLGEMFFALMALEVRHIAKEIHFTLSESVWEENGEFFQSFGFMNVEKSETQYRLFETELKCSARIDDVWQSVLGKLPKLTNTFSVGGYSMNPTLLISLKPEFADRILSGTKKVEIRKRFSTRWVGHRVCLYASRPVKGVVGEATVEKVVVGTPERIWGEYGSDVGCTKEEFDAYVSTASEVYALVLGEPRPYAAEIPLSQLSGLVQHELRPPQSYCRLDDDKPLGKAVSLAALLHGRFRFADRIRV